MCFIISFMDKILDLFVAFIAHSTIVFISVSSGEWIRTSPPNCSIISHPLAPSFEEPERITAVAFFCMYKQQFLKERQWMV